MSLDLWKEFGSPSQKLVENPWIRISNQNVESQSALEEDEFGEFEVPDPGNGEKHSLAQSLGHEQTSRTYRIPVMQEGHSSPSPTTLVKSGNDDSHNLGSTQLPPINRAGPHARKEQASIQPSQPPEPFDDVEWGDFADESISHHEDSSEATTDINRISHAQPLTKLNASISVPPNRARNVSPPLRPAQATQEQVRAVSRREPPPSNVPPPSILLLLIIRIFQSMVVDVKDMIASADSSIGPDSGSDQQSIDKIRKRFSMARAAARIIAGRKLRWRRDSRLSQSMKIGPANSGKSGGMKLAGLDRTENRREDGEVEEAVRTWKQQMGSLRAVVATVNSRQPGLRLPMPEISEKMPIRVGKASEGAMVAPNCCFLCGLKREERVEKVDVQVEDSFGEWWTDYWGHVDCRMFWEEQKDCLNQR